MFERKNISSLIKLQRDAASDAAWLARASCIPSLVDAMDERFAKGRHAEALDVINRITHLAVVNVRADRGNAIHMLGEFESCDMAIEDAIPGAYIPKLELARGICQGIAGQLTKAAGTLYTLKVYEPSDAGTEMVPSSAPNPDYPFLTDCALAAIERNPVSAFMRMREAFVASLEKPALELRAFAIGRYAAHAEYARQLAIADAARSLSQRLGLAPRAARDWTYMSEIWPAASGPSR